MPHSHSAGANRILLFDLETSPNLGYVWGKYEQDVIEYEQEFSIICFSVKWLDGRQYTYALPDFKGYKGDPYNDKDLVELLHQYISQADIIVAHNGDKFDVKKMNTRFIYHGLEPPSPYKTVDTLKEARRHFGFNSNRLDDLGNYLGVGRKVQHSGYALWKGCMTGDVKAWRLMKKYNKQDVILLENVYKKLRPWMKHPNLNTMTGNLDHCPKCDGKKLIRKGYGYSGTNVYQKYKCKQCGGWCQSRKSLKWEQTQVV